MGVGGGQGYIEVPRLGWGVSWVCKGRRRDEGEVLDFAFFEVVHVDVDTI